ncbi:MAG: LCP family protein [Patescibacteria group bacterium]|nr:LCP family protein [Patescibacteria group bacterium]
MSILGAGAVFAVLFFGVTSGFTLRSVVRHTDAETLERELPQPAFTPVADPDRLNVLLLGIRGVDDPNGGLLADAIVLLSVRKSDGSLALVSIPRDLYANLPNGTPSRINAAYALGEAWHWGGGGLVWSRRAVEHVTGVKIDHTISVDLAAFKDIVDALGGVTITLDKPFAETAQWVGEFGTTTGFALPAGRHTLDGATAMYYVRSRFSSSDFDRAHRIQQVLVAVEAKATSLGFLANPFRLTQFVNALGAHVRTDASAEELQGLLLLAPRVSFTGARRIVFDTAPGGLLEAGTVNGAYVLTPQGGNFGKIREKVRTVFE